MQRLLIFTSLASLSFGAFLSTAGCLSDDGDPSGGEGCALLYTPPITLTLTGTAARGAPVPAELENPSMHCQARDSEQITHCAVGTKAGSYDFTITAPGYQPLQVKTTVETSTAVCSGGFKAKALAYDLVEAPVR